jgi:hypothetical protein
MRRLALGLSLLLVHSASGNAAERLRFLNKTAETITELRLAPVGSENWGPNQTENDSDRVVDTDEGLNLKGVVPGRYDVKLVAKSGRACVVRDVEVKNERPYAFSISDADVKACNR